MTSEPNDDLKRLLEKRDNLLIDTTNHHFDSLFEADMALFDFAQARASNVATVLLREGLEESGNDDILVELRTAFTKIIFTFTDPNDYDNSILDDDLEHLLVYFYMENPNRPTARMVKLLNVFAGHWYVTDRFMANNEPLEDNHRRFWFIFGFTASKLTG